MANEKQEEIKAEETEVVKKKGKFKLILLILVVFLGLGGGAGYFFYGDKIMKKYFGKGQEVQEQKKKHAIGPILALEPFLFNLSGSQSKFAKITLGVEVKDPKIMEETKKMIPAIRDKVLSVLGSKGAEVLMDINARNTIKKELHEALKGLFKEPGDLSAIYVTDIIIQ
jgi:flagellar basal body-associated protein FliL